MSAVTMLSRTFRCIAPLRKLPITNPSINQSRRSFVRISRDSFDEIEDRDLHKIPASERGLSRKEFEALSEEEQDAIIAREHEIMELEQQENDEMSPEELPQLSDQELKSLPEKQRKLYLALKSGEIKAIRSKDEDEEDMIEHDPDFNPDEIVLRYKLDKDVQIRQLDPEVRELEERFATDRKFGLTSMLDNIDRAVTGLVWQDSTPDTDNSRLRNMKIDESLYTKHQPRSAPRIEGLDYSQNKPVERPRRVDSSDPNARRDPIPDLEPYKVRYERTNEEMLDRAIRQGPACHQSSFINHRTNNSLTPHWTHMQTANPELIPPKRGANYEDPTSVRYPFIPVLENQRDLEEASTLHRLLQYNRLDATKKFLQLERVRRQLAYQRQYRDIGDYCKRLCAKLPAERVDLKDVKPNVKNLPTHMSSQYLAEMHPHNIPTDTAWMHSLMWLVHDNIKDNGLLSQLEKEQYLRTTQRFCSYAYRQMMKDRASGYYRVMSMPPMMKTQKEQELLQPRAAPVKVHTQSSFLRQSSIVVRTQ